MHTTLPCSAADVLQLLSASADIFPADPAQARRTYRSLARLCHPDVCGEVAEAQEAFALLSRRWAEFAAPGKTVLSTSRYSYVLQDELATGDIATLFRSSYFVGARSQPVVVKLPRSPSSNDLLEREAYALTVLEGVEDPFRNYFPQLVETFRHQDPVSLVERRANVLDVLEGFVSLSAVGKAYPSGLDPRDAAWMWRRLLVAIGLAHRQGIIHGAITPEHVLILPQDHGLVLVDWCYSSQAGVQRTPALIPAYRSSYPKEVLAKALPTPASDIYMSGMLMRSLIKDPPRALAALLDNSTQHNPTSRPQDAWGVLQQLDAILESLYGPRRFRPFPFPPANPVSS